jgi:2-keto-4-pentenoate hydratase/2-oxohepta-3-ene-1,7-dioic acid hydratase in catechol pathway
LKVVTFRTGETPTGLYRIGVLTSQQTIVDLAGSVPDGGFLAEEIRNCFDLEQGFFKGAKDVIEKAGDPVKRNSVSLASPVPRPGKIICIGLNYRNHAVESGMEIPKRPIIFSKFSTAATAPGAPVILPRESEQVDYEASAAADGTYRSRTRWNTSSAI